jgi:hypothetical protein
MYFKLAESSSELFGSPFVCHLSLSLSVKVLHFYLQISNHSLVQTIYFRSFKFVQIKGPLSVKGELI